MNRERAKKLLPIIQAYVDGKDIQFAREGEKWRDMSKDDRLTTTFPADGYDYRIKPEPLECWVRVFDGHAGPVFSTVHETLKDAMNTDDEDIYAVRFREVTDED